MQNENKIKIYIQLASRIENLLPGSIYFITSPRDMTNPPKTCTTRRANDPTVLATITSLPNPAINRKSPDAIRLMHRIKKYCLKNLPLGALVRI